MVDCNEKSFEHFSPFVQVTNLSFPTFFFSFGLFSCKCRKEVSTIFDFCLISIENINLYLTHHETILTNLTLNINQKLRSTNSAERRANHNAVERARRECLNTKFQELVDNLEWVTPKENAERRIFPNHGRIGSRKIVQKTLDGSIVQIWDSIRLASSTLKISETCRML